MRIYKNKDALLRAIEKKNEIIERMEINEINKFKNLGWGYGIRAYQGLKSNSCFNVDKHIKDLDSLKSQLSLFETKCIFKKNDTILIKEDQMLLF